MTYVVKTLLRIRCSTTLPTSSKYAILYGSVMVAAVVTHKKTLASEIERLRKDYGSHDRLADALGTYRQTVIDWEKGAVPREPYRSRLVELGVDPQLFIPPNAAVRLRRLERQIQEALREAQSLRELLGLGPEQ